MSKIVLFLVFSYLFSLSACTEAPKKEAQQTAKTDTSLVIDAPMVGGDADEHGCLASAGYTWSVVKNECIRLFEVGIRLNPKAANLDKTTSAFVVFKSETDESRAELFLPSEKKSILLTQDKKNGAGKWANNSYLLSQWKGMYTLEDSQKKVLYEGMIGK